MKSIASNAVGMATAVACLALVLNRPVGAEDQDKPAAKEETKVISAKEGTKEFTVSIKDGKVFLNGKLIGELKDAHKKEIRVHVLGEADTGAKKATRRKMVFMGKDGKVQAFEFDGDVDVEHVVVGKADKDDATKEGPGRVLIHKPQGAGPHKEIRVRALQLGAGVHPPVAHAVPSQADKVHADVTTRLKNIESELKKIRQLLQKMQDDDGDDDDDDGDDDDDDDEEDEGEHEHAGEHEHEHEHEHNE